MSTRQVTAIGFDADDTLWQNEQFYRLTERHFASLLADFADETHISARLLDAEKRNPVITVSASRGSRCRWWRRRSR